MENTNLPDGWINTKIGNVLTRVKNPVQVDIGQLYKEIGIRSHGKGIFHKEPKTGLELGNKSVFWIEPDCLVVNIVFAWEQAVAKTSSKELGFIASHRFPMYKPVNNKADISFLLYLFKTKRGKFLLELASPGGAGRNKTLGQKEFAELKVILPPISEQESIVSILSTWDKAIEQLTQLIEAKRQRKKALMQRLLTGKLRLPEFAGKEWKNFKLGDIADINSGGTPKSSVKEHYGGNIPWVSIADMTRSKKGIYKTKKYLTQEGLDNSSARLYPKYSVLYAMYASIGECSIANVKLCSSQAILGIRPKNNLLDHEYLYFYLTSLKEKIKLQGQQGTQSNLNAGMVKGFKLNLPSLEEQTRIAAILSAADAEITQLEHKLASYKEQKRGLMQQLLTGKKRVNLTNINKEKQYA